MPRSQRDKSFRSGTVLIADDDITTLSLLRHSLNIAGFDLLLAHDGSEAISRLSESDGILVALLDLNMPNVGGMECLKYIKENKEDTQVIIITASEEIGDAVQAMKIGAFDYVTKPVNMETVIALVDKATETAILSRDNRHLRNAIGGVKTTTPFITKSPDIKRILRQANKISDLDLTVLITGDSGVGKGLLANRIHSEGKRASKPFVTVSCACLPRELVEAELFGHEKGAFTGAIESRIGRLEFANGGTIFLDEIGDMPIDLQPKMLNFLQDRSFLRIGGNKSVDVDVRVIAATHRDLRQMSKEMQFREDLFYRINVLPFHIPPLRGRPEDIPVMVEYFLERISEIRNCEPFSLADDVMKIFREYSWPGNVRELANTLERITAFCSDSTITTEDLPAELTDDDNQNRRRTLSVGGLSLTTLERSAIEQTLDMCRGNKAKAARILGISEKSIYNKMKRLGVK